jgi:AraC-like DNA-binding protein
MDDRMKKLDDLMMTRKNPRMPISQDFRPEGFAGQHLVVLPDGVIRTMRQHPLLRTLFPTATGFFPKAPGHLVDRPSGVPDWILIPCLSGRGWVQIGDCKPVTVEADEIVFIPPGTPHIYGADPELPWSITWAHCQGTDLAHFIKLLGVTAQAPVLCLPPGEIDQMEFSAIYQRLEHSYTETDLLASAARLRLVFTEIHRLRVPGHAAGRSREMGLQQSIQWMRHHLDQPVSLSELARIAGLSIPHYSALFRRKTGFAPVNYFQRLKIQRACQWLDTTGMSIQEIAVGVGCEDPYYFSRLFKKIMGRPPRDYRKIPKG